MVGKIAIGLSGFAGTGKTTAALYLEREYGFKRLHIAEPMRAMLAVLMRANGIEDAMIDRYLTGDLKDGVPIPELCGRTSRELQLTLGTEWGREYVGEDLWADTWAYMAQGYDRVMNDSVRFANEETAIRGIGGFTIRIERPGFGPVKFRNRWCRWFYEQTGVIVGAHPSERVDLLNPDYVAENTGAIDGLYRILDGLMAAKGLQKITAGGS